MSQIPETAKPTATPPQVPFTAQKEYEPCQECGAPLDAQQRYCVNCAARRANGANPASRYFAAASRRARRPDSPPPPKSSGAARAAAVGFFALLPIAVALGIVVGRSGGGEDNSALIEALRKQAATPTTASLPSAGAATGATGKAGKAAAKGRTKGTDSTGGKVVANTAHGVVHEVTNYKPTQQKVEEDTKQVEEIATEGGADYIKTQKNLPDVITVGGDPASAPPLPSGAEP
jgi:hypothetical protein